MALPKKKSRSLYIDGIRYRWLATTMYHHTWGLCILAELYENPGQRMMTWVDPKIVVTGEKAREAILYALSNGWNPSKKGNPIQFGTEHIVGDMKTLTALERKFSRTRE